MNDEPTSDASAVLAVAEQAAGESVLDYLFTLERDFERLLLRGGQAHRVKSRGRH